MARGFESKDIEFQQEEAARRRSDKPALTREAREVLDRRRTIELALAKARAELAAATRPAHRDTLERAIEVLVERLGPGS